MRSRFRVSLRTAFAFTLHGSFRLDGHLRCRFRRGRFDGDRLYAPQLVRRACVRALVNRRVGGGQLSVHIQVHQAVGVDQLVVAVPVVHELPALMFAPGICRDSGIVPPTRL